MIKNLGYILIIVVISVSMTECATNPAPLKIAMQQRILSDTGAWELKNSTVKWIPTETAIVISDMWDKHWCDDATKRVAEMAPAMDNILSIARNKGVKIVHAPSDCMDFYKDYPGRKAALKYKDEHLSSLADGSKLFSEKDAVWPIDQSDEGCENADCKPHRVWTKQIDKLSIKEEDLISDSGAEIGIYFKQNGIKNVILVGVHTNMCIVNRSFGLRAMQRMGLNTFLMRDMTDLMYNPAMWPYVDHFAGLNLMVEYIEKYISPTILSTEFTGEVPFRFIEDERSDVTLKLK